MSPRSQGFRFSPTRLILVTGCLAWLGSPALAAEGDVPAVAATEALTFDDYIKLGVGAYNQGNYEQAIEALEAAYHLRPEPEILFNLAQARRKVGKSQAARALALYEQFLREAPQTPLRERAVAHVADLRKELGRKANVPESDRAVEIPARRSVAARPEQCPVQTPPPPPPQRPYYKRAWFWVVITSAAVGLASGIAAGAILGPQRGRPDTDLGTTSLSFGRAP